MSVIEKERRGVVICAEFKGWLDQLGKSAAIHLTVHGRRQTREYDAQLRLRAKYPNAFGRYDLFPRIPGCWATLAIDTAYAVALKQLLMERGDRDAGIQVSLSGCGKG